MTNHQPIQGRAEEPGHIARSVAVKTQWMQRALSPWVQRWLQTSASPETGRETHFGRYSQTALTTTHTNSLLDRVQHVVDRGTVWRADVGSLEPTKVERFTSAIVDRFPTVGAKYEPQPLDTSSAETTDLILAGNVMLGFGVGELYPEPSPLPSMAALREALAAKPCSPESPPAPRQALPRIQRAATEPPRTRQLAQALPPQSRLFSQVEELSPGEKALNAEFKAQPTTPPDQPETAPEPSRPARPPSPPVQRQPDWPPFERGLSRPIEAPSPATEDAAQPVEAEPTRPSVERPAVQRQPDRTPSEREPPHPVEVPPPETEDAAQPMEAEPTRPPERPPVQRQRDRSPSEREPPRPVEAPTSETEGSEAEPTRPSASLEEESPGAEQVLPLLDRAPSEREPPRPVEAPPPKIEAQAVEAEPPRPPKVKPVVQRQRDRAVSEREPPRPVEAPPPEIEAQAVEAEPPRPSKVTPSQAERPPEPDRPAEPPPVERQPEPAESLEQEVVTRAASRARLPLTEPEPVRLETYESLTGPGHKLPPMALTRPKPSPPMPILRLPGTQVQARFEREAVEASSQAILDRFRPQPPTDSWAAPYRERISPPERTGEASELPLPVVSRPPSLALVQRQPSVSPARAEMISRQEETTAETAEAAPETERPAEQDLDHLARQIYPLIKRMLAIERERSSARWSDRA